MPLSFELSLDFQAINLPASSGGAPVATQLAITTQPSGALDGVVLSVQPIVEIRDGSNVKVPSSTALVTASIASGSGVLSGTLTVAAIAGVATFTNLKITGAGTDTIIFTSSGLASATSSSIVVAQVPTQLAITTQPATTGLAGVAWTTQPVVEIRDANNAKVSGSTVVVTATIATGTGALVGTATAAAVAGVATFATLGATDLSLYTITFSSGILAPATSASFANSRLAALIRNNGGDSVFLASYVRKYGQSVTGSQLQTWADARGAVGPAFTGHGTSKPAVDANGVVTFDGSTNWIDTALSSQFNLSTGVTFWFIGTIQTGTYQGFFNSGGSKYWLIDSASSIQQADFGSFPRSGMGASVPTSTTPRLIAMTITESRVNGVNSGPVQMMCVGGKLGRNNQFLQAGAAFANESMLLSIGRDASSHFTPGSVQAMFVTTCATPSLIAAMYAYVAAEHTFSFVAGNTRAIIAEGDSNTFGEPPDVTNGTNDWLSQLLGLTGFTTNFDTVNNGVAAKTSAQADAHYNTESGAAVAFAAQYCTKVIPVDWQGANDLQSTPGMDAPTLTASLASLGAKSKAAGGTKNAICTILSSAQFTGPEDAIRLVVNTNIGGGSTGHDIIMDIANRPNLLVDTSATYRQSDHIHLSILGEGEVATEAQSDLTPFI